MQCIAVGLVFTHTKSWMGIVRGTIPPMMKNSRQRLITPPKGFALLALSLGAAAVGAIAIGAVAVGAFAIGKLGIRQCRIDKLEIGDLTVDRLTVREQAAVPGKDGAGVASA